MSLQSTTATTIDSIGDDVLRNILGRLPALSFAYAACANRSWNRVCDRLLSRPNLSSACSFNPLLHIAVEEVVTKVLSEPIRPHFAIVSIGPSFSLQEAHQLITARLGSEVPIITHCSAGVIGRDAFSNEFKELKTNEFQVALSLVTESEKRGIMLMIGFMPGMKVKTISLQRHIEDTEAVVIDKFITDIREFSSSVSGSESPAAIIMFSGLTHEFSPDLPTIMENLDYAMSPESVIVGESSSYFQHSAGSSTAIEEHISAGVALVLVMDRNKPSGIGKTQFDVVLSCGLLPEGPTCEVASVKELRDGMTIVTTNVDLEEVPDFFDRPAYIGVIKRRLDAIGQEKVHLSFHRIASEDPGLVYGLGIEIGDTFRMYRPHPTTALSSARNVSNHLRSFKQGSGDKREVFGGMVFACCGRGESFLGEPDVDSSVFLDNFPGVTFGGAFCCTQFGRGHSTLYFNEAEEQESVRCCVCEFSAMYLIMSYIP